MNPRKPVTAMSNRELLEETAELVRALSDTLAEFEPFLALVRATSANGARPSYVQAAGLRRSLRKARADAP